ncbi:hypothetical protein OFDDKENP_00191 [Aeromonas phage B614]|nr:hypothetical protein OFDDKENP_00191 [Aeromonas phage B614]UYD58332.1 hypothetical protein JNEOFJEA_00253 [Aeromonas phage UP87]
MEIGTTEIVLGILTIAIIVWVIYKARRVLADILGAIFEVFD